MSFTASGRFNGRVVTLHWDAGRLDGPDDVLAAVAQLKPPVLWMVTATGPSAEVGKIDDVINASATVMTVLDDVSAAGDWPNFSLPPGAVG